jgi:hypothetical protein
LLVYLVYYESINKAKATDKMYMSVGVMKDYKLNASQVYLQQNKKKGGSQG